MSDRTDLPVTNPQDYFTRQEAKAFPMQALEDAANFLDTFREHIDPDLLTRFVHHVDALKHFRDHRIDTVLNGAQEGTLVLRSQYERVKDHPITTESLHKQNFTECLNDLIDEINALQATVLDEAGEQKIVSLLDTDVGQNFFQSVNTMLDFVEPEQEVTQQESTADAPTVTEPEVTAEVVAAKPAAKSVPEYKPNRFGIEPATAEWFDHHYKGSLEFQVGKLCNQMGTDALSAQQKQSLATAIPAVLGGNQAPPLTAENLEQAKDFLLEAIPAKYPNTPDKLEAFLSDLASNLGGDYPLEIQNSHYQKSLKENEIIEIGMDIIWPIFTSFSKDMIPIKRMNLAREILSVVSDLGYPVLSPQPKSFEIAKAIIVTQKKDSELYLTQHPDGSTTFAEPSTMLAMAKRTSLTDYLCGNIFEKHISEGNRLQAKREFDAIPDPHNDPQLDEEKIEFYQHYDLNGRMNEYHEGLQVYVTQIIVHQSTIAGKNAPQAQPQTSDTSNIFSAAQRPASKAHGFGIRDRGR